MKWKKMDDGGKVSPKWHFRVAHCQEGAQTIFSATHRIDVLRD